MKPAMAMPAPVWRPSDAFTWECAICPQMTAGKPRRQPQHMLRMPMMSAATASEFVVGRSVWGAESYEDRSCDIPLPWPIDSEWPCVAPLPGGGACGG